MLPLVALLAVVLGASPALTVARVVIGSAAALVQALGLVRWPFAVPELARRYVAAEAARMDAARRASAIEVTFATLHRLLGVGIGEHLGYLLTGSGPCSSLPRSCRPPSCPGGSGWLGVPIGVALLVGTLEFVGPNERDGWPLAGTIVRSPTSPGRSG